MQQVSLIIKWLVTCVKCVAHQIVVYLMHVVSTQNNDQDKMQAPFYSSFAEWKWNVCIEMRI